jgi:RNA polymerase sigma factor (sigma-70 family)
MMMNNEQIEEGRKWSLKYAMALTTRYRDVLPVDDVVSLADLGLVEAWRLFDGSRGIPFTGYASQCVKRTIWEEIQKGLERKTCEVLVAQSPEQEAPLPVLRPPEVADALKNLSQEEQGFVREHFFRDRTLSEIAKEKGRHRAWASRLLKRVLLKLRAALARP